MRKIVGFIFFILSVLIIASILVGSIDSIIDLFSEIENSDDLLESVSIFALFFWDLLYQPVVVLLLSVIAMGSYSK